MHNIITRRSPHAILIELRLALVSYQLSWYEMRASRSSIRVTCGNPSTKKERRTGRDDGRSSGDTRRAVLVSDCRALQAEEAQC